MFTLSFMMISKIRIPWGDKIEGYNFPVIEIKYFCTFVE